MTLHGLFEAQARREPGRTALVFEPEPGTPRVELTYGELDRRAGALARRLRSLGVGPEQRVAVSLDRSPGLLVALLAILKAGGAYAPLDPSYPRERLALMMEDAFAGLAAPVLLTRDRLLPGLPDLPAHVQVLCLEGDGKGGEAEAGGAALPGNLAYLIFTSGSTGRPKAVAIEHRSAVELVRWARETYSPEELAAVFAGTSVNFDLSIFELFVPLSCGGRVVLGENSLALARTPAANEVTLLNTVPSAMAELLRMGAVPASVRTVNLAGEPLRGALARRIHELGTVERLWNLYGPSEDTTYSTGTLVPPGDGEPTIGRPLPGTRAQVLDEALDRAAQGDTGELFLAGAGLARGYLNRPDLTAERFVPDPFSPEPGGRMYRTGDLVRLRPDGDLDYLGRADHQVKIRGFRIELGEIEAALASCPGLRDAAVLAREDAPGEKRLVAYVVGSVPSGEILGFLRRKVPDPMLPSAFVFLDEMPLNPNGKIDRGALARIAPEAGREGAGYAAPRTPVEEALAGIWAEALGLDRVGIEDPFLELGGQSLLGTRILLRVREVFGIGLPLRALFEASTVEGLAALIALGAAEGAAELAPIPRAPRSGPLPLSFAQERLWLHDRLVQTPGVYALPYALHFAGGLDSRALERAVQEVVRRHEVLRTVYVSMEEGVFQLVLPFEPRPLPRTDLRELEPGPKAAALAGLSRELACPPFDLERGPVVRWELVHLEERRHVLLLNIHHIAADGWSVSVLAREVGTLYAAFSRGLASPLPELPVQYADFAVWDRERSEGGVLDGQIAWWKDELAGAPGLLDLPADRPRPPQQSFRGARRPVALPPEVDRPLRGLCRGRGATPFMALLAGFQALLHRYTGQEDLLIGSPVVNRSHPETEGLIGFFVNTVALRGRVSGDLSFERLLERVKTATLGAFAHQDVPFERLVDELRVERSLSHNTLLQVAATIQVPLPAFALPEVGITVEELHAGGAPFDLFLALFDGGEEGLAGFLEYASDLFDGATVDRLAQHLVALLGAATAHPGLPLEDLPLLGEAARAQVLAEWNDTRTAYPRHACIHGLFEEQARRTPEAVALKWPGGRMTYAGLDARAGELARHLRAAGVGPDRLVGVFLERSPEAVVALLAILKAGGAFAPLDPAYPPDRLAFMLEDTAASVLVTRSGMRERLPDTGARLVLVDDPAPAVPAPAPTPAVDPDNLAYVMYTSGSTGRPKGVAVTHRNVVRLVRDTGYADFGADQVFLQLAPLAFDASTLEIWGPLLNGGTLVVYPAGVPTLEELGAALVRDGITTLWLTAGLFHQMVEARPESLRGLRQLLAGGDVLSPPHVDRLLREAPGLTLINGYGPTESTTFACCHPMREPPAGDGAVPIGRPISNTRVYVLDRAMRPVPVGGMGELFIGGDGLARGYLGRPELTGEKFVPDPSGTPGERLYRTGDLTRFRPNGEVEFLGRIDQQVKIRGFRIEPGEIEAVLSEHPAVAEAAVVVQGQGGDKRLLGCVVRDAAVETAPDLRAFLEERLPSYMVPYAFVWLDALPLNPNGKVDRRALAALRPREPARARVEPRTPTEARLAGLMADLLQVDRVGRDDDFFELGGHSLLAIRLLSKLRWEMGVELSLRAVFEAPTVAGLAARVDAALAAGAGPQAPPILPRPRRDAEPIEGMPLSFSQERLWFLDRLTPGLPVYNIPLALRLSGTVDRAALQAALDGLVQRHEALCTTFLEAGGQPRQRVERFRPRPLPIVDLRALPDGPRRDEARLRLDRESRLPFDLARGPLLRAVLLVLDEAEHALSLTLHHIVGDGWSLDVLVRDLAALYRAALEGGPPELPRLPVQYPDYALWQRRWLTEEALERQVAWWRQELEGAPVVLELPADRPRPAIQSFRGGLVASTLPAGLAAGLRELARARGATVFMTLLAAFQTLLHRMTGQDDVLVGSPVAGRGRPEVEDLIGFFVNTLVLRGRLAPGEIPFREALERTRQAVLGAFAHQDVPFEKLVGELRVERSLAYGPLFQVMFSLQARNAAPALPGLGLSFLELGTPTAKFDLLLAAREEGDGFAVSLEYAADLFDAATAARILERFGILLDAAVADPERPVAGLPVMGEAERRQVLEAWNDTGTIPSDSCLHELVEAQIRRTPDAVALVGDRGERWTYADLGRRARRISARLRQLGVRAERPAGVSLSRTPELVAALLGVLRAGGCYVPLDPAYPRERLSLLLEDTGAPVVITESALVERLPELPGHALLLDREELPEPGDGEPAGVLPGNVLPGNLAYLIYTSGSTGRPKGVAIEHRSAVAFAHWARTVFGPEELAGVFAATSVNFDLSVFELFVPLCWGGTVILGANALALPEHPAAAEVRLLNTVPSAMTELVRMRGVPPGVRTVNLAGEPLRRSLARQIEDLGTVERLLNLYGPSEDTTYSTWTAVPRDEREPTLGRPLAGTRVYLLDRYGNPVPIGVAGELCLGGAGLARGYLGRPELTAERFVPDPLTGAGERLYRTGDLARWLPSGELEYLGRIDHQVKVRGFRIELGEIEAALLGHPAVREAAVLALGDGGDRRLTAWVVPEEPADLRAFLARRLPDYMIPSVFVALDALPLTPNGKVDRKALAKTGPAARSREVHAPPRTPVEERLAAIWAELVGVERVGVEDDFFDLGGHSLLGVRCLSRVRDELGVDLPLRVVFEGRTVAGLAAHVEALLGIGGRESAAVPPLVPREREPGALLPLSFAQERLWFLDRLAPGEAFYNMPFALALRGPLDLPALAAALNGIVRRHETLRATFQRVAGEPRQRIEPFEPRPLLLVDLSGLPGGAREAEALLEREGARPFDLERGPLLRAFVVRLAPARHELLLAMHHIAADGWSLEVLLRDLAALYGGQGAGADTLPELPVRYADFAAWQRDWLRGRVLEREIAWWRAELEGAPLLLDLPTDRPRPAVQSHRGDARSTVFPPDLEEAARSLGAARGATLFMVLLAAFQTLLHRISGGKGGGDVLVGSPVANRNRREIEDLVGFFVNTLALRGRFPREGLSFRDLVDQTRATALAAYAHEDLPFERLVEELQVERRLSHNPVFQVLFAVPAPIGESLALRGGLEGSLRELPLRSAKVDLSLDVIEGRAVAGYATDLFDAATVDRLLGHFRVLLAAALEDPGRPVGELPLLTPAELRQLREWSDADSAGWTPVHERLGLSVPGCILELRDGYGQPVPIGVPGDVWIGGPGGASPGRSGLRARRRPDGTLELVESPPEPVSGEEGEAGWEAPRTATEVALAALWAGLLDVQRVGLRDDFFELGGHSLLAMRLLSRMADELGVELPLRTLFESPVLADLAARVDEAVAAGASAGAPPIVPVPRNEAGLPLSFAQERFWFLYQLQPESPRYIISLSLSLRGDLDVAALGAACIEIVRRHEALRTVYADREGRGVQRILPPSEVRPALADLRSLPEEVREPEALRLVQEEQELPFDLERGPMARFRLVRLDGESWLLLVSLHHIAADGWSTGLLLEEISALYGAFSRRLPSPLAEPEVQYADFAAWQRGWLQGEALDRLIAYWRDALKGAPARIDLPLDRPRPAVPAQRGATRPLVLPPELLAKAETVSRQLGATLFMTLLAAFQAVLHRITGQPDLLVGTPVAGRTRRETEGMMGCFVNTLVLRGRLDDGRREEIAFRGLVERVRAVALGAFAHQDLPFERLVEELHVERSLSWNPLFQVFFALQNAPLKEPELRGIAVSTADGGQETALFDLTLGLGEHRGELVGGFQYDVELFDAATVDRWARHLLLLLDAALEDPDRRLADLPGLAEPERRQVLAEAAPPEEELRARVAEREDELAGLRSGLSDQKRAALQKLLRARVKSK